MEFFVGVSGFSYTSWKGKFYPKDLKSEDFLSFYAEKLNSVEINSSFYAPPSAAMEILGRQNRRRFPFRNKITSTNYPHTQNRQGRLGGRRSTGKHPRFARSETWTCVVPTTAVFQIGPENSRILPHTDNGCEEEGVRVQA